MISKLGLVGLNKCIDEEIAAIDNKIKAETFVSGLKFDVIPMGPRVRARLPDRWEVYFDFQQLKDLKIAIDIFLQEAERE